MFRIAKYFLERELGEMVLVWVVGICALILSICFGWVATTGRDGAYFWPVFGYVLSALGGTIIYLSGWLGLRRLAKSYVRKEFKRKFEVGVPGKRADAHERSVIQTRVDYILIGYAERLNGSCNRQELLLNEKTLDYSPPTLNNHLREYRGATKSVQADKQIFWHCHAVARLNGMKVHGSFRGYLNHKGLLPFAEYFSA